MLIVPFKAEHFDKIELQPHQEGFSTYIADKKYGKSIEQGSDSFTAFDGNKIIGCAGLVEQWDGRAVAWALLSKDAGKHMLSIVRKIDEYLNLKNIRRVEASSICGFKPGARLLEMLGFEYEGIAKKYTPDGQDVLMYARVRG